MLCFPLVGAWPSSGRQYPAIAAVPVNYSGPGDVVSGAAAWWGFRAYDKAVAGNVAANICNVSDATCADVSTNSSGSLPSTIIIGGSNCASVTCTVKKLYDQTQGGNCSGSCDLVQATIANRPVLTHNCIGSLWCMTFSANGYLATAGAASETQPFTVSTVYENTVSGGTGDLFFTQTSSTEVGVNDGEGPNVIFCYAGGGSVPDAAANDQAFHAAQVTINGAHNSGNFYIDGTSTTMVNNSPGGNNISDVISSGGRVAGTTEINANINELGLWPGSFTGANDSAMNSNQHSYWGF